MPKTESAVTYDGLPIGRGGAHALGRISGRDALAAWLRFLDLRTEPAPIQAWFDFPTTPGLSVDPDVVRLVESEFPLDPARRHRAPVPFDRAEQAVALLESIEPQPTNRWGMAPVWLWFTAAFRIRSPTGPGLWPGQDPALFGDFETPAGIVLGTSSTRLALHAKCLMGLRLSIPLATDGDLATMAPWLQEALPMRLSSKHWARWVLTKDQRSYRATKVVVDPGRGAASG